MKPASKLLRRTLACLAVASLLAGGLWWVDSSMREQTASAARSRPSGQSQESPEQRDLLDPIEDSATLSADQILQRALQRCLEIQDYHCTIESINWLDAQEQRNILDVIFKRPGRFRHTLVDGEKKGTLLTRSEDGLIQVRPGGVLGLMVVEISSDDTRLLDGRGVPFYQSDWATELARLQQSLENGATLNREADANLEGVDCWVLRVDSPPPADECNLIWIERETLLPKRFQTSRNGQRIRLASYSDVTLNTGPADDLFRLK